MMESSEASLGAPSAPRQEQRRKRHPRRHEGRPLISARPLMHPAARCFRALVLDVSLASKDRGVFRQILRHLAPEPLLYLSLSS